MALSPTIPTSFVPKQPVQSTHREPRAGWDIFSLVAFVLLGVAILGAGGVFLYQKYLEGVRDSKEQELIEAEKAINAGTVEEFIRLSNRFKEAQKILDKHVAFSGFLDILEARTLQNVRFNSLVFDHDADGVPVIDMSGVARSFNALAAQSSAINEEKKIKRAIFSGITVNANNTVSFTLTAQLDPSLLVMKAQPITVTPSVETGEGSDTSDTASSSPTEVPSGSAPPPSSL